MKAKTLTKEDHLFGTASNQGGYFTAQQALRAGYSKRLQHYHRKRGHWLLIQHGLFRLRNFPHGRWEDLIRWSLWSRNQKGKPQAVVSYESAALFHELADYLPMKIHLTVPPGFRKQVPEECVFHKARISSQDAEIQQGFRVTTPYRTLRDLAQAAGERERWAHAVEDAAKRGLITRTQEKVLQKAAK
jgi:predicted transcriptional regulator of viral defense system